MPSRQSVINNLIQEMKNVKLKFLDDIIDLHRVPKNFESLVTFAAQNFHLEPESFTLKLRNKQGGNFKPIHTVDLFLFYFVLL